MESLRVIVGYCCQSYVDGEYKIYVLVSTIFLAHYVSVRL